MKRRELLTGAAATAVVASFGGASVTFGISSALAQGGPQYTYMAPSRITLFQSYLLIADTKGYFKDEGLNIKIQAGTTTVVAVQQVSAGAAAFGMAAPISTCAPIADQKAPIITIGQIGYRNFWEIASLPAKPLKHPRDWQGKTVGITSVGGAVELQFDAMSMAVGLDPKNVKKVTTGLGPSGLAFLQRGDIDGFFVFYESKLALNNDKVALHYLPADDFAPLPGDALITSRSFADDAASEQVIVKFLRACRKGVEYMQNEKNYVEIIAMFKKYNPIEGEQVEKGKQVLDYLKHYMKPSGNLPRLKMSDEDWAKAVALLEKSDVIKTKGLGAKHYYTNKFIDKV
jgi:ABC-type nitrate/sulfonate/bicarbonate transport system substrate-binding protein